MSRQAAVHQRGCLREGFPHYLLLHSDEESGVDEEIIPLLTVNRLISTPRKIEVINLKIKPNDTLQALALRYRCTVSELKQINKIDKENEIYAKHYIKVPVQPFSALIETLVDNQECNSSAICTQHNKRIAKEKEGELIQLDVISPRTESLNTGINTIILNSVCEPLSSYNHTDEVSSTQPSSLSNIQRPESTDSHTCMDIFNGAGDDCGLSWMQLLVCIFLLLFIGPIIYIYITHVTNTLKTNITVIE